MDAQQRGNVETIRAERSDGLSDIGQVGPDFVLASAAEYKRTDIDENGGALCEGLTELGSDDALIPKAETDLR